MTDWVERELALDRPSADRLRRDYWLRYGATLLGLVRHHAIDPHRFLRETHDFDVAELLRAERGLATLFARLPGRKLLLTNAPARYAAQVIQHLGLAPHLARRYGIGVAREGFTWSGTHKVTAKREWPDWRPPEEMLKRQPDLPRFVPGGPDNPLGARALYLGSTLYRIHGSNEPWTIGQMVSSGCIRMRNEDVADLYERVKIGTRVVVM